MSSPKSSQSVALIGLFNFQSEIFNNAFTDISEEQAFTRPGDNSNHINWLLGHILNTRYMLANILGVDEKDPNGDIYFKSIGDEKYVSLEKIKKSWPSISKKLISKIENLTDEEINAEIPNMGKRMDLINFFVYHEAYHIGQIGYARKLLGLTPLKSN